MPQYDAILRWDSAAEAKADAIALAHSDPDELNVRQWMLDHVIPNVKVWRASQDTVDGGGNVTHNYLPGYYVLISATHRIPALEATGAIQLVINRDKMNAREAGFVVRSTVAPSVLQDIRFEPVFCGMDMPWGGLDVAT